MAVPADQDLQLVRDVAAERVTPEDEPWVFDDDILSFAVGRLERAAGGPERLVAALVAAECTAAGRARVWAALGDEARAALKAALPPST